jgi:hypothetical protein
MQGSFYRPERPGTGVASVGAGAVSVEAPVAGMIQRAWVASAGVGVTSVVRWRCRVMTDEMGSSGTCRHGRGNFLLLPFVRARLAEGRAWERDA